MRWLSWIWVILSCVAVAAGLGYFKYAEIRSAMARAAAFPEQSQAVEVHVVSEIPRTPRLVVPGEVVATRSAALRMELGGRLEQVGFEPGAVVEPGQLLLQLDVAQERAQLAEAKASRRIAELDLNRAERLVKSGAGSVENRDQALARFDAALARTRALEALIEKKTLRAPFAGRAGLHQLEAGQFIDAGAEVTTLIGADDLFWIDFSLPQEFAELPIGSLVQIGSDQVSSGEIQLPARVIARDATVSDRSRNLKLRAELAGGEGHILPGMLVEVRVDLAQSEMAVVVPATSVRRGPFGASVYVLETRVEEGGEKTRAVRRAIEVAVLGDDEQEGDMIVVTEGLRAGERVAGVGAFKLRDGALVSVSEPNEEAMSRLVGH